MSRRPVYVIDLDGKDVSSNFSPLLISLSVTLYDGEQTDTAEFELDDTAGQIGMISAASPVSISLGWADDGVVPIFTGYIDEPTSTYSRGQGRVLLFTAKGANSAGKAKQRQNDTADKTSFGSFAQTVFGKAGIDVSVAGALSSIQREHWSATNESAQSWGYRIAKEIGATFVIRGNKAIFTPRAGGSSVSGIALGGIVARAGEGGNLISSSICPTQGRPSFGSFAVRHYDIQKAEWVTEKVDGPQAAADGSSPTHTAPFKAANADQARAQAMANAAEAAREHGAADHVVIDGDATAQPEAPCSVVGVRDGVDGSYTISRVVHDLRRGSGFTTTLGLKQPTGGAGTDSRVAGGGEPAVAAAPADTATPVTTPANSGGIGSA